MNLMRNITNPRIDTEILNYLNFIVDEGLTYTEFWTRSRYIFPRLYLLAQKYKCFSVTEVDIERLFSRCSQILTSTRNRMRFDHFSKLTILQYNLSKSSKEEVDNFFKLLKSKLVEQMKFSLKKD